jgi:hypothetical protein
MVLKRNNMTKKSSRRCIMPSIRIRNEQGEFRCAAVLCCGVLLVSGAIIVGTGVVVGGVGEFVGGVTGGYLGLSGGGVAAGLIIPRPMFRIMAWIYGENSHR